MRKSVCKKGGGDPQWHIKVGSFQCKNITTNIDLFSAFDSNVMRQPDKASKGRASIRCISFTIVWLNQTKPELWVVGSPNRVFIDCAQISRASNCHNHGHWKPVGSISGVFFMPLLYFIYFVYFFLFYRGRCCCAQYCCDQCYHSRYGFPHKKFVTNCDGNSTPVHECSFRQ